MFRGVFIIFKSLWLICDLFVVWKGSICENGRASYISVIIEIEFSFYGRVNFYLYVGGIVILCIGIENKVVEIGICIWEVDGGFLFIKRYFLFFYYERLVVCFNEGFLKIFVVKVDCILAIGYDYVFLVWIKVCCFNYCFYCGVVGCYIKLEILGCCV